MTNVVKLEPRKDVPDFITRHDISSMTDDQLDAMVSAIQTRRMAPVHIYKQTLAEKAQIQQEKDRIKIEKKCEQIIKKINMIDKHSEDLEKYISELRGLRLQAGLSVL